MVVAAAADPATQCLLWSFKLNFQFLNKDLQPGNKLHNPMRTWIPLKMSMNPASCDTWYFDAQRALSSKLSFCVRFARSSEEKMQSIYGLWCKCKGPEQPPWVPPSAIEFSTKLLTLSPNFREMVNDSWWSFACNLNKLLRACDPIDAHVDGNPKLSFFGARFERSWEKLREEEASKLFLGYAANVRTRAASLSSSLCALS